MTGRIKVNGGRFTLSAVLIFRWCAAMSGKAQEMLRKIFSRPGIWKSFPVTCRKRLSVQWLSVQEKLIRIWMARSVHTRCCELTLEQFMNCLCDGNLATLRRHRLVGRRMLEKAWRRVVEEYAGLSHDPGYQKGFLLSKEIARENGKLLLVRSCLQVLWAGYSEACAGHLRALGYGYRFDPADPGAYRRDLERVEKKARMIGIEQGNRRKQYEKASARAATRPVREKFVSTLAVLSRYMGFRIDPERVTVAEYLVILGQYEKEIKALNKNSKKT